MLRRWVKMQLHVIVILLCVIVTVIGLMYNIDISNFPSIIDPCLTAFYLLGYADR